MRGYGFLIKFEAAAKTDRQNWTAVQSWAYL